MTARPSSRFQLRRHALPLCHLTDPNRTWGGVAPSFPVTCGSSTRESIFRLSPFNPKKWALKPHARRTFFQSFAKRLHLSEISLFSLRFLPAPRNALESLMGAKLIVAAKILKVLFVRF